jgi:hypothetical protein
MNCDIAPEDVLRCLVDRMDGSVDRSGVNLDGRVAVEDSQSVKGSLHAGQVSRQNLKRKPEPTESLRKTEYNNVPPCTN